MTGLHRGDEQTAVILRKGNPMGKYYAKPQIKLRCGSILLIHVLGALSARPIWLKELTGTYFLTIAAIGVIMAGVSYFLDTKTGAVLQATENGGQQSNRKIKIRLMHSGISTAILCLDVYLFCRISFGDEVIVNTALYALTSLAVLAAVEMITYRSVER